MKLLSLCLAAGWGLAGCAGAHWVQSGKTDQQVNMDNSGCLQTVASKVRSDYGSVYLLPTGRAFSSCMESKGYQLSKE